MPIAGPPPLPETFAIPAPPSPTAPPQPSSGAPHDGHSDAAEPLYDPYLLPPPPPRGGVSGLALSAIVAAFLGPVGAILAIVFGHYARREIERTGHRRSGYALATAGLALGVVLTMAWGGFLSYIAWTVRYRVDPAGDEPAASAAPPSTPPATAPKGDPPADVGPFAPKYTKVKRAGDITVVDVGMSSSSLGEELARQRAEAATAGETLMVMTTAARCAPCRGVDQSLTDPLLQTALAKVRLVRVDMQVFHEDLEQLKIPDEAIPGFFLLSLDLTPRDGVNGGEWDDDIPVNIAPVLGAFARGRYAQRRQSWRPIPSSGMTL
ncbi:Hypothetical protein A7982_01841 [Minicystis rosea]|nr:Hypothetical protein A7982_01841 [Minicystis rosea]